MKNWLIIIPILLAGWMYSSPVWAEESTPPDHRFRVGVGLGIPYGFVGINLGAQVNRKVELFGGFGTAGSGFKAWSVGGRVYPFVKLKRVRPRLTGLFGVVAAVYSGSSSSPEATLDVFEGFGLGAGLSWTFFNRQSIDFDLFYIEANTPDYIDTEDRGRALVSLGYGIHF